MNITWIHLLLLLLATARITQVINADTIFEPIRHWIYMRSLPGEASEEYHDYRNWRRIKKGEEPKEEGVIILVKKGWVLDVSSYRKSGFFGSLISCTACLSVWTGALVVAGYACFPHESMYLYAALSASMTTILLHRTA